MLEEEKALTEGLPEGSLRAAVDAARRRQLSLSKMVHELEEKLGSVLGDSNPSEDRKEIKPEGQCVLATDLLGTCQQLGYIEEKILDIIERLGI